MCLAEAWTRALTGLALLAVDPGLGGLALRARVGPVREAFVAMLGVLPLPLVRLHPAMGDEALFGGLDLSGTLAAGRMVATQGLLARPAAFVLPMAERAGAGLAARLGMMLDAGGGCLIALDEGTEEEGLVPGQAERLAFGVDLSDVSVAI